MIIYFSIFFVFAFLAIALSPLPASGYVDFKSKSYIQLMFAACFLFLTIFIGLRFNIGGDFGQYRLIYSQYFETTFLDSLITSRYVADPGFGFINWLIHQFDPYGGINWNFAQRIGGYNILNLVCAGIFSFFFLKFSFKLPRPFLVLAMAFPYLIVVVSMGYVRQGMSIAIVSFALIKLCESNKLSFIALVCIAALLHKSAVIFLPLVAYISTSNKFILFLISLIFFSFVVLYVAANQVERLVSVYIAQGIQSRGAQLRIALLLPAAFFYLKYKNRFSFTDLEHKIWDFFSISTIVIFILVLTVGSSISTSLDRIALYYIPFSVLILSLLPEIFEKRNALLIILALLIYYLVLFSIWLLFADHNYQWLPYQNILFFDTSNINHFILDDSIVEGSI